MSSPLASATATAAAKRPADTRNLHWKTNNVGLKLLEKLGWKEGQAVGKRQRQENPEAGDDTEAVPVSSEGLRVVQRANGLGLGASSRAESLASSHHVQHFSNLLEQLKEHHPTQAGASEQESSKRSKKKAKTTTTYSTTGVVLPTNKTTHHKIRAAKFTPRTADDMRCIFGGATDCTSASDSAFTSIQAITNNDASSRPSKKQKKADKETTADESSKKKKKSKKDKKDKKKSSIQ
jgi:hypothetical protein